MAVSALLLCALALTLSVRGVRQRGAAVVLDPPPADMPIPAALLGPAVTHVDVIL